MSSTPETDSEEFKAEKWCPKRGFYLLMGSCVPADLARRLERERDEAMQRANYLAQELADPPADVQEAVLTKLGLWDLLRERDELRNAVRNLQRVKGRHHSQQAYERLIALLPDNQT